MNTFDYSRRPDKRDSLHMLRRLGVEFTCILDVGVQDQTKELIEVFPDLKHYLFEPVRQYIPKIQQNYSGIEHEVLNFAVSNRDGPGQLRLKKLGGEHVTHSAVVEGASAEQVSTDDIVKVDLVKLSTFLASRLFEPPILLKIDVDGHEDAIIDGLSGAEGLIGAVVIEANASGIVERIQRLTCLGFDLWDILDPCYYKGCLAQVDLILVSMQLLAPANLNPLRRRGPFEWRHWQSRVPG